MNLIGHFKILIQHVLFQDIIIKLSEPKTKSLKRKKQEKINSLYKGTTIRHLVDFSAVTLQVRREWDNIFKVLKERNCQPRILYPAKLFSELKIK